MKGSWAVERLLGLGPGAACVALGGETGPEAAKRRVQLTEAPQSPTAPRPHGPCALDSWSPLPVQVPSRRGAHQRGGSALGRTGAVEGQNALSPESPEYDLDLGSVRTKVAAGAIQVSRREA